MTQDVGVSHDHLFKQVLGEFFPEFIELFFPQVAAYLDRDSIEFLPLEVFADLLEGKALETDIIVKAKFQGQETCFIIHVEHQANYYTGFDRRVFQYFALLDRDYGLPVYPIDTYLKLEPQEETILQEELDKIGIREKETVMNIVTSWMEQGIEQGKVQEQSQSRAREANLLVKLLRRNLGAISATAEQAIAQLSFEQFEQLADALFDFTSEEDLLIWLNRVN
jgi:Domain of unknown function (DUF4351)